MKFLFISKKNLSSDSWMLVYSRFKCSMRFSQRKAASLIPQTSRQASKNTRLSQRFQKTTGWWRDWNLNQTSPTFSTTKSCDNNLKDNPPDAKETLRWAPPTCPAAGPSFAWCYFKVLLHDEYSGSVVFAPVLAALLGLCSKAEAPWQTCHLLHSRARPSQESDSGALTAAAAALVKEINKCAVKSQ